MPLVGRREPVSWGGWRHRRAVGQTHSALPACPPVLVLRGVQVRPQTACPTVQPRPQLVPPPPAVLLLVRGCCLTQGSRVLPLNPPPGICL